MASQKLNNIEIGRTRRWKFTFTDGAATPSPINVTGWKIAFMLKSDLDDLDASAAIDVTTTAGDDTDDDLANGVIYLTITSDDTAIAAGSYFYDFTRIIEGTPDDVRTIASGRVRVVDPVRIDT